MKKISLNELIAKKSDKKKKTEDKEKKRVLKPDSRTGSDAKGKKKAVGSLSLLKKPAPPKKDTGIKSANTIYLVDTENVGAGAFFSCMHGKLKKKDKICLLYTDKTGKLDLDSLDIILKIPCRIYTEHVNKGPNALDFQLVSILGGMIAKDEKRNYSIVSNDHGYDAVVSYWTERGISISRLSLDPASPAAPAQASAAPLTAAQSKISDFLKSKKLSGFDIIKMEGIFTNDDPNKQLLLLREFGAGKTKSFYSKTTKGERDALARSLREPEDTAKQQ